MATDVKVIKVTRSENRYGNPRWILILLTEGSFRPAAGMKTCHACAAGRDYVQSFSNHRKESP